MLTVLDVHKAYGEIQALRGASLEVLPGSIVSLLGRNGAGKSTLLSIIAGLLRADSGTVSVNGIDVTGNPAAGNGLVGIAPQKTGVYPPLTVRENLEFFGELAGLRSGARKQRAQEVAEQLGLAQLLDRKAMKLSGGEARRLHTGCALVHQPKVLMLDEPTVGADVETRSQLIDAVRNLAKQGAAIIYTTHYLPEVEALDASIVIIDAGKVLTSGTRQELVAKHSQVGVEFETAMRLTDDVVERLRSQRLNDLKYRINEEVSMQTVLQQLSAEQVEVTGCQLIKPDLESVFLTVTGASL